MRGHNEGNAAAKLVFDTDCGGIDGNEPLGEALNVSMVNPLLAQPRNAKSTTRRNRFVYPLASLSSPSSLLVPWILHPFLPFSRFFYFLLFFFFLSCRRRGIFVRKFCELFSMTISFDNISFREENFCTFKL